MNVFGTERVFSDSSIKMLTKSLGTLENLEELEFRLAKWGFKNEKITDISLFHLGDMLTNLKNLRCLDLDIFKYIS